jgi:peptidoglycan/xylan/chitin deacetylase (PgdA/CDA1 family)
MPSFRGAVVPGKIGRFIYARPMRVAWPEGVVSFTFDDFPKSALAAGGNILERYGARGTYYVSMKLAGTDGVVGPMFDRQDVRAAHAAGHEIGCHTYTHPDFHHAPKSSIPTEIRENGAALSSLLEGFVPTNFAYPHGSVSVTAKRVLGPRFSSCRGTGRGINHGLADFADLLANTVYAVDFDDIEMRSLIDRNTSVGGWLIFYTHDVAETPSPFGCKPGHLEAIVAYAAERTTILPVRDVIAGLAGGQCDPNALAVRYSFARKKINKALRVRLGRLQMKSYP